MSDFLFDFFIGGILGDKIFLISFCSLLIFWGKITNLLYFNVRLGVGGKKVLK